MGEKESAGSSMSDIAVESADAVLVGDDIERLPDLFRIARKVMKKVGQNIVISLCINLVAVALSVFGVLNPVTGALMHNGGSVFVVLNAAMLLRGRDEPRTSGGSGASRLWHSCGFAPAPLRRPSARVLSREGEACAPPVPLRAAIGGGHRKKAAGLEPVWGPNPAAFLKTPCLAFIS
ncbi:MAG: hypothetical protein VB055_06660 [Oscillospiraceae bacterium]|nr:hypothetical protein [Oscillospiraceae bacterium]